VNHAFTGAEFCRHLPGLRFWKQGPAGAELTNDVLLLSKSEDSMTSPRYIVFTTKYRTLPASARIEVGLQTPGDSISYAF
jgi:hypothetical protein